MARHAEDEVVARADVRTAAHLFFEDFDDVGVRDAFVGLWIVGVYFFTTEYTKFHRVFLFFFVRRVI